MAPIERSCLRMFSMFLKVQTFGWMLCWMAAFSAGNPKASKPMGKSTLYPFMRLKRARASLGVMAYQWPMCRSPEG